MIISLKMNKTDNSLSIFLFFLDFLYIFSFLYVLMEFIVFYCVYGIETNKYIMATHVKITLSPSQKHP